MLSLKVGRIAVFRKLRTLLARTTEGLEDWKIQQNGISRREVLFANLIQIA